MNRLSNNLGNANTIDDVIHQLDEIISMSNKTKNKLGYFASLYRMVTIKVKEGILNNQFEDGARMESLDVNFANFYLKALKSYLNGEPSSLSWQLAFRHAQSGKSILLQNLLLGINAHINLDLGVAAAMVCKNADIQSLYNDFMNINRILASLVDEVRDDMDRISPWIGFLDHIDPKASKAIINFSLEKSRNYAWNFAKKLAGAKEAEWEGLIKLHDHEVASIGKMVANPTSWMLKTGLWAIRLGESKNIERNLDLLNHNRFETAITDGIQL
ncbi:DUF5995 family protein [Bacillus sp. AFS041924]|uniref:DUF5995 family protein n=1 Tax=Bacillus sp. AFS041924 TaxID=2033503 RepID=UPI000BFCFF6C|nr:DUF5995 family protein [Bacillus sp. AFS041924]PGS51688.1 hypothetical protein COC46_11280 [Bacillus sp. AFS041924]